MILDPDTLVELGIARKEVHSESGFLLQAVLSNQGNKHANTQGSNTS